MPFRIPTLLIAAGLCLAGHSAARGAGPAQLVLDETAYFRAYVVAGQAAIDYKALVEEGEKVLGAAGLSRLERETKRRFRRARIDWRKEDWRRRARLILIGNQAEGWSGGRTQIVGAETGLDNPPPPADWMRPSFDDGSWPRLRYPLLASVPAHVAGMFNQIVEPGWKGGYFRCWFRVSDPARAALTLRLVYRGGARLFVNGKELARAHLPAGALDGDALADGYPMAAYVAAAGETPCSRPPRWTR